MSPDSRCGENSHDRKSKTSQGYFDWLTKAGDNTNLLNCLPAHRKFAPRGMALSDAILYFDETNSDEHGMVPGRGLTGNWTTTIAHATSNEGSVLQ